MNLAGALPPDQYQLVREEWALSDLLIWLERRRVFTAFEEVQQMARTRMQQQIN